MSDLVLRPATRPVVHVEDAVLVDEPRPVRVTAVPLHVEDAVLVPTASTVADRSARDAATAAALRAYLSLTAPAEARRVDLRL